MCVCVCVCVCVRACVRASFLDGSNVRLIDDGSLSPFQGRLTSASSVHASLLQAIDCVMSLALCPLCVLGLAFASTALVLYARSFTFAQTLPHASVLKSFRVPLVDDWLCPSSKV